MSRIETLARQAWQLRQQGHGVEEIADVMGRPTSSVERWLLKWERMSQRLWHEGLEPQTVLILSQAGIDSREALLEAWESGEIQRGKPSGIGVAKLIEIRSWVETSHGICAAIPSKAFIVDLVPEAEAALRHLQTRGDRGISQVINEVLIAADHAAREE